MGRRSKRKYGIEDVAEASGERYLVVLRDVKEGRLNYLDLLEVSEYIVSKRNPFIGELIKAGKEEEEIDEF